MRIDEMRPEFQAVAYGVTSAGFAALVIEGVASQQADFSTAVAGAGVGLVSLALGVGTVQKSRETIKDGADAINRIFKPRI